MTKIPTQHKLALDVLTNDPKDQNTIIWNDKDLKIRWPKSKPILSTKDKNNQLFKYFFGSNEKR